MVVCVAYSQSHRRGGREGDTQGAGQDGGVSTWKASGGNTSGNGEDGGRAMDLIIITLIGLFFLVGIVSGLFCLLFGWWIVCSIAAHLFNPSEPDRTTGYIFWAGILVAVCLAFMR